MTREGTTGKDPPGLGPETLGSGSWFLVCPKDLPWGAFDLGARVRRFCPALLVSPEDVKGLEFLPGVGQ